MLSYLHAYHAGCLADVHKHGLLSVLLQKLTEKDRPLTYMETHAGRGVYDLESAEALKTREAEAGIQAILSANCLPSDHPYAAALRDVKAVYGDSAYPGSPAIARTILRENDHLHLMELHPKEIAMLKRQFRDDNCHCHHRDGYEGVLGVSPPKARRGLVLIDPSFEVKTEYDQCVQFIKKLHKKWPEAVIALWYPILGIGHHKSMVKALEAAAFEKVSHRRLNFDPIITKNHNSHDEFMGMIGTGLYIINCPWGVEDHFDGFETMIKSIIAKP